MVAVRCDLCEDEGANLFCKECKYHFCSLCCEAVHEDENRKGHTLEAVGQAHEQAAAAGQQGAEKTAPSSAMHAASSASPVLSAEAQQLADSVRSLIPTSRRLNERAELDILPSNSSSTDVESSLRSSIGHARSVHLEADMSSSRQPLQAAGTQEYQWEISQNAERETQRHSFNDSNSNSHHTDQSSHTQRLLNGSALPPSSSYANTGGVSIWEGTSRTPIRTQHPVQAADPKRSTYTEGQQRFESSHYSSSSHGFESSGEPKRATLNEVVMPWEKQQGSSQDNSTRASYDNLYSSLSSSLYKSGPRAPLSMDPTRCGLGVQLRHSIAGKLTVAKIMPGGSAERNGELSAGDQILNVDGVDTERKDIRTVANLFVGKEGSICMLTVLKEGDQMARIVRVERGLFTSTDKNNSTTSLRATLGAPPSASIASNHTPLHSSYSDLPPLPATYTSSLRATHTSAIPDRSQAIDVNHSEVSALRRSAHIVGEREPRMAALRDYNGDASAATSSPWLEKSKSLLAAIELATAKAPDQDPSISNPQMARFGDSMSQIPIPRRPPSHPASTSEEAQAPSSAPSLGASFGAALRASDGGGLRDSFQGDRGPTTLRSSFTSSGPSSSSSAIPLALTRSTATALSETVANPPQSMHAPASSTGTGHSGPASTPNLNSALNLLGPASTGSVGLDMDTLTGQATNWKVPSPPAPQSWPVGSAGSALLAAQLENRAEITAGPVRGPLSDPAAFVSKLPTREQSPGPRGYNHQGGFELSSPGRPLHHLQPTITATVFESPPPPLLSAADDDTFTAGMLKPTAPGASAQELERLLARADALTTTIQQASEEESRKFEHTILTHGRGSRPRQSPRHTGSPGAASDSPGGIPVQVDSPTSIPANSPRCPSPRRMAPARDPTARPLAVNGQLESGAPGPHRVTDWEAAALSARSASDSEAGSVGPGEGGGGTSTTPVGLSDYAPVAAVTWQPPTLSAEPEPLTPPLSAREEGREREGEERVESSVRVMVAKQQEKEVDDKEEGRKFLVTPRGGSKGRKGGIWDRIKNFEGEEEAKEEEERERKAAAARKEEEKKKQEEEETRRKEEEQRRREEEEDRSSVDPEAEVMDSDPVPDSGPARGLTDNLNQPYPGQAHSFPSDNSDEEVDPEALANLKEDHVMGALGGGSRGSPAEGSTESGAMSARVTAPGDSPPRDHPDDGPVPLASSRSLHAADGPGESASGVVPFSSSLPPTIQATNLPATFSNGAASGTAAARPSQLETAPAPPPASRSLTALPQPEASSSSSSSAGPRPAQGFRPVGQAGSGFAATVPALKVGDIGPGAGGGGMRSARSLGAGSGSEGSETRREMSSGVEGSAVLMEGWLTKATRSAFQKAQRRWCVARRGWLHYYHKQNDKDPATEIALSAETKIHLDTKGGKGQNLLVLTTAAREYTFKFASTEEGKSEAFKWLQGLREAMTAPPPPQPTPVHTSPPLLPPQQHPYNPQPQHQPQYGAPLAQYQQQYQQQFNGGNGHWQPGMEYAEGQPNVGQGALRGWGGEEGTGTNSTSSTVEFINWNHNGQALPPSMCNEQGRRESGMMFDGNISPSQAALGMGPGKGLGFGGGAQHGEGPVRMAPQGWRPQLEGGGYNSMAAFDDGLDPDQSLDL